jgi:AcrR family transcriptional regulator
MNTETKTRTYRKRRRAEQEQRTRERITEAAVELHGSIGPARTTVTGIAERAGVQRATVYRHFPTERDIFEACSAHYRALNPPPNPVEWTSISDPGLRLRRAFAEIYGYYERTEPMRETTSRDAPLVPAMAGAQKMVNDYLEFAAQALLRGRPERGAARKRVAAAIGHALAFPTWQSLVRRQELDPAEAVEVMAAMVECAGAAKPGSDSG